MLTPLCVMPWHLINARPSRKRVLISVAETVWSFRPRVEVYCSTFPLVGRLVGAPRPFHEGGPEEDCRSQLSFPFWTGDHHTGNRGLCEFPTTDFCVRRGGWGEPINPCPFSSGSWQRFLLRLVSTLPHLIWVRDGSQIWDQESGYR